MSLSMYSASVPTFVHMLGNLSHLLGKAAAHAEARKFDPANLLSARLFPDMLPMTRQVHIACDAAKLGTARLAGVDAPKFEDNETTFAELQARCQKTIDFLVTLKPEQVDGSEERLIEFPVGPAKMSMPGQAYLLTWVMPNFFFHITTAYALLRHNGVEIGKRDYLTGGKAPG